MVEELARLKALYTGFQYRELARIVFCKTGHRIHHQTIKRLWQHSPPAPQGELPFGDYHSHPDRYQACGYRPSKLYVQGWRKRSISQFLQVSRPPSMRWIRRFEAEHFAGLQDKSRAPKAPARKVWLPLMVESITSKSAIRMPGSFASGVCWPTTDISVRTVERIMALNQQVYDDIPHVPANMAPSRHRSRIPTKPRVPTSIGSSTAA